MSDSIRGRKPKIDPIVDTPRRRHLFLASGYEHDLYTCYKNEENNDWFKYIQTHPFWFKFKNFVGTIQKSNCYVNPAFVLPKIWFKATYPYFIRQTLIMRQTSAHRDYFWWHNQWINRSLSTSGLFVLSFGATPSKSLLKYFSQFRGRGKIQDWPSQHINFCAKIQNSNL